MKEIKFRAWDNQQQKMYKIKIKKNKKYECNRLP